MKRKNTNCLEGFKCPKCGQQDELLVNAEVWVSLKDEGTDVSANGDSGLDNLTYNGDSIAECPECGYGSQELGITVNTFFSEEQEEQT